MLTNVRSDIAQFLSRHIPLTEENIRDQLEVPKQLAHGHLALPVFALAKTLRKAPPLIAKEISEQLRASKPAVVKSIEPLAGYVNLTFEDSYLQETLMRALASGEGTLGHSSLGAGRKMVIDYVSPNVAKPMHIGHLRATVIGQAIRNLAETQGYEVVGLNHLGDWGVQFGKLTWAFLEWGDQYPFESEPFKSLYAIYVRFHEEEEKNPELSAKGSEIFLRLEAGDPQITAVWKRFVDISLVEYQRLLDLLGVKHDLVRGESFYNDQLKPTEEKLARLGLLEESDGAMIVRLDEDGMAPCLIRKSDGASLYATRDLASAIYRKEVLGADINLYVVGDPQTLHFKQVFRVLEKMGYAWAKDCHHIGFGQYRFKEGSMSTRKGNAVFLEDVVSQGIEKVRQVIAEKNPELPDKDKVARQVGVGAIIFNDLMNDRIKNVEFDWERVLDFEGDSGPYVQYCHVRCVSVQAKAGGVAPTRIERDLATTEERELVRLLLQYQDTLAAAARYFKPNILAQYLLDVCRAFNHFYHKHRILGEEAELQRSRLALVGATRSVLKAGLKCLSMEAPNAM